MVCREIYIYRVDWYYISRNTNLSEAFFEKYIDRVNWSCISRNHSIVDKTVFTKPAKR
jgi:hypothetical protein